MLYAAVSAYVLHVAQGRRQMQRQLQHCCRRSCGLGTASSTLRTAATTIC